MKLLLTSLALSASIALAGCGISSPGSVSVPSCDGPQYQPLPAPAIGDSEDAGDVAGRLAVWGKSNEKRMRARAACELNLRHFYGAGQ